MDDAALRVFDAIADIPPEAWDALSDPEDHPFTSWTFLEALESGGSAVPEAGWWPRHLTLWRGQRLVAAAPAYAKTDSMGDFSRDWGWAHFAEQQQVRYYPKLVVGVPFTPVPGRRILIAPDQDPDESVAAIMALALEQAKAERMSGVHVLFCDPAEIPRLEAVGFHPRVLVQFHWHNRGYPNTDAWMATLTSKRRNQIKRERREVERAGIALRTVRDEVLREDWSRWSSVAYELYRSTCDKFVWGRPYLTRAFYQRIFEKMPANLELVTARLDDRIIAGAFNLRGNGRLFGRYWGCHEEHRFLHFNVCLYHSIEECIARGTRVFEGGMGGEHKLKRGFEPVPVDSAHRFLDPKLDEAIGRHCRLEKVVRMHELDRWREEWGRS